MRRIVTLYYMEDRNMERGPYSTLDDAIREAERLNAKHSQAPVYYDAHNTRAGWVVRAEYSNAKARKLRIA